MKIVVWVGSSLLALAFLFIGGSKLFASTSDLQQAAQGIPVVLLKIAGTAEVLGAIGLVLPAATRILPILTPIAAVGLVVTMIGATITDLIIGEPGTAVVTVILGTLAGLVARARFGPYAVEPRNPAPESKVSGQIRTTKVG